MPTDDDPEHAVGEADMIHARDGDCNPTETAVWGTRGVAKGTVRQCGTLCHEGIAAEARRTLCMAASQQATWDERQRIQDGSRSPTRT